MWCDLEQKTITQLFTIVCVSSLATCIDYNITKKSLRWSACLVESSVNSMKLHTALCWRCLVQSEQEKAV